MAASTGRTLWRVKYVMPVPNWKRPRVDNKEYWFDDFAVACQSRDLLIMQALDKLDFLNRQWAHIHETDDPMPPDEICKVAADPVAYWDDNVDEFVEYLYENSYMDESPSITLEEFKPVIHNVPVTVRGVDESTCEFIETRYKRKALATPTTSLQPAEKKEKLEE